MLLNASVIARHGFRFLSLGSWERQNKKVQNFNAEKGTTTRSKRIIQCAHRDSSHAFWTAMTYISRIHRALTTAVFFGPGFGRNHTMIYIQMVPWVVVIIYSNLCSLYVMWVKQGVGASKRPCVSAHGYISIQWCSKVSPQRERFFTDIYILWVCQKSWKGMEKWVTVWFQWFLWDESHHVGKDSCTLFLLQRSIYITRSPTSTSYMMLNKILYIITICSVAYI